MTIGPMALQYILLASTSTCSASISSCFSSMYVLLFGIAATVAVAVIVILALIYGISSFIGRSDIRVWVRVKIFDTLFSLLLIAVFMYASTNIIYNIPLSSFNTLKLAPPQCSSATSNIYSLSTCDMYQFNNDTSHFEFIQYWFTIALSLVPQLDFNIGYGDPFSGSNLLTGGLQGSITLLPPNLTFKYLGAALDALYVFSLANEVQLIILSSSALIFAILMATGLLARIFGITKTFGGAMIAFAFGIGLVYPALIALTYGFIDYGLAQLTPVINAGLLGGVGLASVSPIATFLLSMSTLIIGSGTASAPSYLVALAQFFPQALFSYIGLIAVGLTIIPLIDLVIVDVFIIDFSQAIGERMDLLNLLIRVL